MWYALLSVFGIFFVRIYREYFSAEDDVPVYCPIVLLVQVLDLTRYLVHALTRMIYDRYVTMFMYIPLYTRGRLPPLALLSRDGLVGARVYTRLETYVRVQLAVVPGPVPPPSTPREREV